MDISNLTKNLMKGLEQKNNSELTAISRVLDIALGKVTIAQVTETIPITPQERQALLNKTAEALQQLHKMAGNSALPPAAKEEMSRLLEQQTLIKSPDVRWVNLLVNNRQLLTYSDKPLAAGQTVAVRLVTPEKLVLLDLPESEGSDNPVKPASADAARPPTYTAQSLATQSQLAKSIPAAPIAEQDALTGAAPQDNPEDPIALKNTATLTTATPATKIQIAVVTETAPMTAEERQELLKKTTEELVQLGRMAQSTSGLATPGLKEAVSALLQQQALIKSPDTKWVHLQLGNQALLTYSDKPLAAGQPVPVQMITPQKILLLDFPKTANPKTSDPETDSKLKLLTDSINSALVTAKNPTPTYFARLAAAEQSATTSAATDENPAQPQVNKHTAAATAATVKTPIAIVTETAPLQPQERKELLKKTAEELAQLSKMASASTQPIPGLKEAINSLLQQQALIKSPAAKWIHLQAGSQALLTYSDKPLTAGQSVPVQLVTPQKILLLDTPETAAPNANPTNQTSAPASQKNSTPTYFAKLAAAEVNSTASESAQEISEEKLAPALISAKNSVAATPVKIQLASITETAPLLPQEREELLKKTSEELVQLNKMASATPGVKEAIASLLQQQALIKSPATQWVHLSVGNQSLLTYSDKPLTAGQTVPVQVISPQKIVLLDLPDSNIKVLTESINSALASQKNATPTYFARLAVAITAAEQSSVAQEIAADSPEIKNPTALTTNAATPKIHMATVTQTAPISAEERQELLKKTGEELQQLNKLPSATPGLKDAIASLLQQQALIKSPEAKWVHLQVNNQSLLTYSDKPLASGQTLPVQVITPQKILLLDLPEATGKGTQVKNIEGKGTEAKGAEVKTTEIKSTEAARKNSAENLQSTLAAQKNSTPTYFATLALTPAMAKPQDIPSPLLQKETAVAATATASPEIIKTETATIIKSTPVSPQQRQELLQKISEDLQQINKLANSSAQTIPSVKDVIALLQEQQALLKSPNLKWLELSVNNRPVTTYTDKSLDAGQTLQLQLKTTQHLALIDTEKLAVKEGSASAANTTTPPDKLLPSSLDQAEDEAKPAPALASQWQAAANLTRHILTAKTLEQALKSVAEQIRWQLQLSQPAAAPEKGTTVAGHANTQAQSSTHSANTSGPSATLANNKPGKTPEAMDARNGQTAVLDEIDQVLAGSTKKLSTELTAKLLQELIKIQASQTAATQTATKNSAATQTTPTTGTAQTTDLSQEIELALQQLLNRPASDASSKEARAQLLQLMQQGPETFKEMDISKLSQQLSKGLEQKNNAELTAISRALNIALGKVVMADVRETAPVTPQERKELLAKTTEALAQLNKLPPAQLTPANKAAISQLLEQQALIQSPNLKWAMLMVNNRPLLTYTDKPLSAGQAVPVQLVDAQKLVLLTLPENSAGQKNSAANLTAATLGNNANPTYSAKLANPALLADLAKNAAALNLDSKALATAAANSLSKSAGDFTPFKQDTQQIKQVVAESLRRLLPYKDTPNVLLGALSQWQKLPAASQQRLAPVTVEQALKNLAEQIRSPLQIIQPKILAHIIKNSGVFFESALNASQAGAATDAGSAGLSTTEGSKTLNPSTNPTVAQTFSQDLKGSLLTLLSKVNQELTGSSKPLSEEQTIKLLQQLSSYTSAASAAPGAAYAAATGLGKNNVPVDIGMFIQQVMTKPVKELSDKELRSQLLVLLQQHSVHSLAKIQLQQLASLNSEVASKDPSQPTASWQIEIPVRHHNEVQQLHLRIDREWVEEKNTSEENKTVAKVKQWSVTLRFDLPTLGEFCAQLAIIDTNVSATLWANEEKTFGQVRKQMEDLRKNLEKEGINVKQLQCMKGMPAQKPMALSYSLIDIST